MRREIRPMTVPEIEKWYAEELAEAFAPAERKPLADILSLRAEGRYELLGLFNERDELLGYATIWRQPDGAGLVLLDYLGVSARLRNGGLGAELCAHLARRYGGQGLILESEAPVPGGSPAENELRAPAHRLLRAQRLSTSIRNGHLRDAVASHALGPAAPRPDRCDGGPSCALWP